MNAIRQTQKLNKRELENATPPSASWHSDYRDTAWIYIGGLPLDLSEGDVVTIFSQFGSPSHLNLIRDRETGKSKGFGFLKYEDQRSCDLAVDNFTGADVLGRLLRVDHTRYKKREDEDEDTHRIDRLEAEAAANGRDKRASETEESEDETKRRKKRRPLLKEEIELEDMLAIKENGEDEDPMRDYLIKEKKEEIAIARKREEKRERKYRHRYRDDDDDRYLGKSKASKYEKDSDGDTRRNRRYKDKEHDSRSRNDDDGKSKHRRRSRSRDHGVGRSLHRGDRSPRPSTHRRRYSSERSDR